MAERAKLSVSLAPQSTRYTVNCIARDAISHLLTHLVVYIIALYSSLNTTTFCLPHFSSVPHPTLSKLRKAYPRSWTTDSRAGQAAPCLSSAKFISPPVSYKCTLPQMVLIHLFKSARLTCTSCETLSYRSFESLVQDLPSQTKQDGYSPVTYTARKDDLRCSRD